LRRLVRRLLLLALLASLFAVAACGGDDDGGNSKEDAAAELNDICEKYEDDFDEFEQQLEEATSGPEVAGVLRDGSNKLDEAIDEVQDLDVPEEDKDQFDEFVAKSEEQRDLIEDAALAAEGEDSTRFQELGSQIEEASNAADEAAKDYGADACADDEN
jgi:hypothetical protein